MWGVVNTVTRQYSEPAGKYSLDNSKNRSFIVTWGCLFEKQFNKNYVYNAFVSRFCLLV